MPDELIERAGHPVVVCSADGPPVVTEQDAMDLIASAFGRADILAVPVSRLDPSFFDLRSGLAGTVLQKFVNYRMHLAVLGDITAYTTKSTAFRDLVVESNRGRHAWFVADLAALDPHLKALR